MSTEQSITYPFPPPKGFAFEFVDMTSPYMIAAMQVAHDQSLDKAVPTGSVIVDSAGKIIGKGANGSSYHETHVCERVRLNLPTGQGYELCEGCHPKNHSEPKAIADAKEQGLDTTGSALYLWGHWWCCEPCWHAMVSAGISKVFLLENSHILFNKQNPGNIVGRQFDYFSAQIK